MQKHKLLWPWLALVCAAFSAQAQGTFQNLNFESANVSGYAPGGIPVANALPGWTAYISGNPQPVVTYDTVSLGAADISLHDSMSSFYQPLQGHYNVLLQGSSGVAPASAAIGQIGLIPETAQSLSFIAVPLANLQVTFAGQEIQLFQLGGTPNYNILGGDISAFAGQSGELRFTALPDVGGGFFDNIQFSTSPIPEPGTLGLFSAGALLLGWRLRKRRKL